jgi:hypothetical protein
MVRYTGPGRMPKSRRSRPVRAGLRPTDRVRESSTACRARAFRPGGQEERHGRRGAVQQPVHGAGAIGPASAQREPQPRGSRGIGQQPARRRGGSPHRPHRSAAASARGARPVTFQPHLPPGPRKPPFFSILPALSGTICYAPGLRGAWPSSRSWACPAGAPAANLVGGRRPPWSWRSPGVPRMCIRKDPGKSRGYTGRGPGRPLALQLLLTLPRREGLGQASSGRAAHDGESGLLAPSG